jgi:peroxiredoxin
MNYKEALEKRMKKFSNVAPNNDTKIYKEAAKNLKALNLEAQALKEGDKIPSIILQNAIGEMVDVNALLIKGPIIISFYRGSWCPFCNLELRAYQDILPQIKAEGASLVAISPDLPDYSLTLQERRDLEFSVLSDVDNKIAKLFNLVFLVDDRVIDIYESKGYVLKEQQGNDHKELPIPATYVVDQEGIIRLAYVDSVYQNRLEPLDALDAVKKIQASQKK